MKFMIAFAALLAVASAGHLVAPLATVYGAQHLPVIGPNGVPIDTPEVQHARAAHLAHKVEAHARNGDLAVVAHAPIAHHAYAHHAVAPIAHHQAYAHHAVAPIAHHHAYAHHAVAPVAHSYAAGWTHGLVAHQAAAYPTTAVHPTSVNGVPLETPEVVAAKSHHFAAHAEALARNGHYAGIHHLVRRGLYAAPLAYSAPFATSYAHHHHAAPLIASSYAGYGYHPYGYSASHLSLPHHYY